MPVEQLDQLGEIGERPGQTVDLVDDDDIDLAAADIIQQLLQRGAVERGARQTAIVVAGSDQPPALVGLTLDVGLASRRRRRSNATANGRPSRPRTSCRATSSTSGSGSSCRPTCG
jgi:hypothetical protein